MSARIAGFAPTAIASYGHPLTGQVWTATCCRCEASTRRCLSLGSALRARRMLCDCVAVVAKRRAA